MASEDQDQRLVEHIPHRLRACLPFLTLQEELMPDTADEKARQNIRGFCLVTAALEGRMVALRSLIEFVGIRERKGKPARAKDWQHRCFDPFHRRRPTDKDTVPRS